MQTQRYNSVSRLLHWLIAGLIVSQYVLAKLAEIAEEQNQLVQQLGLLANHKSVGMTVLVLAVIRLLWRLTHRPPALPRTMPNWQKRISTITHLLIYALIFTVPLSGWLMSSGTAYSVSWFNLFAFPDLIAPNEGLAAVFHEMHHILVKMLAAVVVLHILAALKHQFIDKDSVMGRMASWFGWLLFVGVIGLVISQFGQIKKSAGPDQTQKKAASTTSTEQAVETSQKLDLPHWDIDYPNSFIKFSGDQAGAPFEGRWEEWQADMQFDAAQSKGKFDVTINIESVNSNDSDRDETILGSDFFDVQTHKEAKFVAQSFTQNTDGSYSSEGTLSMKGLSNPAELNFTLEETQGVFTLKGNASLDRLLWNIGMGDWTDTTWVGKDVLVEVLVVTQ